MGSRLEKNSDAIRKRIRNHTFEDEEGEEYQGSKFGGFTDYFRRKKIKLQNLDAEVRAQAADNPKIFRGVVCHVNGYTQPSLNDLHRLVVIHGGGFMQYLDGKTTVTHIIASSLTPKKAIEFRKYRIVKPAWIVDSIRNGKLLPWHLYRVLDEGAGQKVLGFDDGQMVTQVVNKQRSYRDQSDASWYTNQLASTQQPNNTQLLTSGLSSPFGDGTIYDAFSEGEEQAQAVTSQSNHQTINRLEAISPSQQEELAQDPELFDDEEVGGVVDQGDAPHTNCPVVLGDDASESHGADFSENTSEPTEYVSRERKRQLEYGYPAVPPAKKSKLTAEEHNIILLSDPRIRQSSVLNPDFLEQYYRESRLHHLSAWKADLKAHLQAITAEKSASQKAQQKRPPGARRYILHVDFDSFFVAVSLKKRSDLVDKPACVAHGPGPQSEIASCNYPARAFGVKNGMWMKKAQELCKDQGLEVLPYDFPAYEEASRMFYDAIMGTGGIVQSVSIDEALVDVSMFCIAEGGSDGTSLQEGSIWREQAAAENIAQKLRDCIKEQTGCAVSVGIGGNILLAKVALRKAKPEGQYYIKPDEVLDFIAGLEVQSLPGVAWSIGGKLEEIGIKMVKDIRETSKEKLVTLLGPKTGEKLYNYARGIDRSEVGEQVIRKSVSAEVNWGVRFETQEQAEEFVESLCGELHRRLLKERVKGKQFTMKIMKRASNAPLDPPKHLGHGKCDSFSKSIYLGVSTDSKEQLAKEALSILRSYTFSPGELRGLGVQMTKLEPSKSVDIASSQRRLEFRAGPRPASEVKDVTVWQPKPIQQSQNSQKHLQFKAESKDATAKAPSHETDNDPIVDDPETPKKPRSVQFEAQKAAGIPFIDSPGRRPLNTMGTQFIMPTQVDPKVLAELPPGIRAKFAGQVKASGKAVEITKDEARPKSFVPATFLPNQSQLDPDIFNSLPEDVRAEILEHYSISPSHRNGQQALLPQSPHKNRVIAASRKTEPTRGRPRGGGLMSRFKAVKSKNSTLTQSNFTTSRAGIHDHTDSGAASGEGEINTEFLEALPEDIRREVLAQHRAQQLKRHGGIELARRCRAGGIPAAQQEQIGEVIVGVGGSRERVLLLPRRPNKPTFTSMKLSSIEDLRTAVSSWHEEFQEEGPYEEDVQALGSYLRAVVIDEGDMHKAVSLVKWIGWTVEESSSDGNEGSRQKWKDALERAKVQVRTAVQDRGLGRINI